VGLGLGVLGLSSFAFVSIAARALGPAVFAPVATLWVIVNAAGPALFEPLEQELGRSISQNRAHGLGSRGVFVRVVAIAAALVLICTVALIVLARPLARTAFDGHLSLVAALLAGLVGLGAENVTRGAFAGGGNFARYGWQLGLDGTVRVVAAAALAGLGVQAVGWYGAALAAGPITAVLLTAWRVGPAAQPAPSDRSWGDLAKGIGVLMSGTILAQFVVNAAPIAASILAAPEETARAGIFVSVLVLARIPLFVFFAVQAALLPGLTTLLAKNDLAGFRHRLTVVLGVVAALGLAGLGLFVAMGPWIVELFYGREYQTTRGDVWPLAAGAAAFMVAVTLAQTLIALRAYTAGVLGWALGSVAFLAVLGIDLRLEQRVGYAFLAATLIAAAFSAVAVRRRLRQAERSTAVPAAEPVAVSQPAQPAVSD
jgi:O-antigen/teichoic acid export membrane protein